MRKLFLLSALCYSFIFPKNFLLNAQTTPVNWEMLDCGANSALQMNLAADTSIQTVFNQFRNAVSAIINNTATINTPTAPYVIPVVFHVISQSTSTTTIPSYSQIQWQLATLNAAFSNSLNSLNNVSGGSHAVNTQIKFCLAKQMQTSSTPTAWPTSSVGVKYYSTATASLANVVVTNSLSLQGIAALTNYTLNFPPNMYLNIWCVPNITSLNSGYSVFDPPTIIGWATYPWMNLPADGVFMRNDCIGNNTYNNFTMFTPLDKGNILAHEVGHYLGLFHTFESIVNGSLTTVGSTLVSCYGNNSVTAYTDGDLVYDTPPTLINGNVGPGPMNTCNETYAPYGASPNENDQLENFMSYTDDDFMNTFTLEQAARMWAALGGTPSTFLTGQRGNLVTNTNLNATGVNNSPSCGPGLLTSVASWSIVSSQITCSTSVVQFNTPILPGYLSAVSYSWNFGDGTGSNSPNPLHTFTLTQLSFTVQLSVSDGTTISTSFIVVKLPNGTPKIVGQSGSGFPVCRNSEQTIFIEFPAYATSAILTDGSNFYTVNSNLTHTCTSPTGLYRFPYTFTITNNASFSLVPANCGTVSTGVASFTVIDCCTNLLNNGDFEGGNVGYYSDYILNTFTCQSGKGAINYASQVSWNGFINTAGLTGKCLMIDSYMYYTYTTCANPGVQAVLAGQAFTGLKPSTNYYLSFKTNQSQDSISYCGPVKLKLKLKNSTNTILDKNMVPSTVPQLSCMTLTPSLGALGVFNFTVTTPASITTATSFSIEILEIDKFDGNGFDHILDNITVSEMNAPIVITPLSATSCPGSTVQLTASNNCVNISNYNLSWQPQASLSCNNCANPIASPSITTVYTLIAIPPSTSPPSANIVLTATVFVPFPAISVLSSTPCSAGTFTLNAGGVSTVTWQPGNNVNSSVVVSPAAATVYSASYGYSSCVNTSTVLITPPSAVTISASSPSLCSNIVPTVTLTGSSGYTTGTTNYTWLPGGYVGNPYVSTPTTTTTYTVYLGSSTNTCVTSQVLSISVVSACCSSTLSNFTSTAISANTSWSSPLVIMNSFTVQSGNSLTLTSSEFLFAPDVKISVANNASLNIVGSHLYACGSKMWQGLVLQNGGQINIEGSNGGGNNNLIEDAKTAIDISNYTSSNSHILEINYTTFNKNYIGISVENYSTTLSTYPFNINNCVFTCRNLLPTSTAWPQAGTTSSATNTSADLRFVSSSSPTTGLSAPYLTQGFTVTPLKEPYNFQTSHIGIKLSNVGLTSGNNFYGIELGQSSAGAFNLFDAQGTCVDALNSNVTLVNNVYQNTQRYIAASPTNTNAISMQGGRGVVSRFSGVMNGKLDLTASAVDVSNRFWNCHIGIEGDKIYRFNITNGLFRSTQSSTTGLSLSGYVGEYAIFLGTNRFQYYIMNNEFTNINTGVFIPLAAAAYTSAVTCSICAGGYGIYAANIAISNNTFAPVTGTTSIGTKYFNNAINISSPNQTQWWIAPDYTASTQGAIGTWIENNTIDKVFRGIYYQGFKGFPTNIRDNIISLTEDNVFSQSQHGIDLSNCMSSANVWHQYQVTGNYVKGIGTNSTTNTSASLFYHSLNTGLGSPSVACNDARDSYNGFVFSGLNTPTTNIPGLRWLGNSMQNLSKAMVLTNTAIIGAQGNFSLGMGNTWNGSWPSGMYSTYCTGASSAALSPIFANSTATPSYPPNNDGASPQMISYYNGNAIYTTTISSDYSCGAPTQIAIDNPIDVNYGNANADYIAKTTLYRFLHHNDSLRGPGSDMLTFYDNQNGNSIDLLMQAEQKLFEGSYADARTILSSITATNDIESNYLNFYTIYANYQDAETSNTFISVTDSSALFALASLCPEANSSSVYQARALYNFIYKQCTIFPECEYSSGALFATQSIAEKDQKINNDFEIDIFPNPTNSQVTIVSTLETESFQIFIRDITGRIVFTTSIKPKGLISTLDFELINGIYFLTLDTNLNEKITKKLLISK